MMKRIPLLSLFFLACWLGVFAQQPIQVSGVVTQDGAPVNEHPVTFYALTSAVDTTLLGTVFTNPNGHYENSIDPGYLVLLITTPNCDSLGGSLNETLVLLPPSNTFTVNFELCLTHECGAAFTAEAIAPLTIGFNNLSVPYHPNSSRYYWDFGDGNTSNEREPIHHYAQAGTYSVYLLAWDSLANCEADFSDTVVVTDQNILCTAFFTHEGDPNHPRGVQFNSASDANATAYRWDFGDGTASDNPHPYHLYGAAGAYTVCLTVTDLNTNCTDTRCEVVLIEDPGQTCEANFTYTVEPTPAFEFVARFTNLSLPNDPNTAVSFVWDFGDGTESTEREPEHIYIAPGIYEVCLKIETEDGCSDFLCKPVVVGDMPCSAEFEYEALSILPFTYRFSSVADPQGQYLNFRWDFGDGTTSNEPQPLHDYAEPGRYLVCLVVWNDDIQCETRWCDTLVVEPLPGDCEAAFTYQVDFTQAGFVAQFINQSHPNNPTTPVTYTWDFGDGTTSNEVNPVHVYQQAGIYTACLKIETADGCASDICKPVVAGDVYCGADFEYYPAPNTPFGFQFVSVADSAGQWLNFKWDFGDGTFSDNPTPYHEFPRPGVYEVCLLVWNDDVGCEARFCDTLVIDDGAGCRADFRYEQSATGTVHFFDQSHASAPTANLAYYWTFGDGSESDERNPVHHYDQTGVYEVCLTIWDNFGCSDTICKEVEVGVINDCSARFDFHVGDDGVVDFATDTTHIFDVYLWDFGTGNPVVGGPIMQHQFAPGTYRVCLVVEDDSLNCRDEYCATVVVDDGTPQCEAAFEYETAAGDLSVQFINHSRHTDPARELIYVWEFGDNSVSFEKDPFHTYDAPGEYEVCLSIMLPDSSCFDRVCKRVRVGLPDCHAEFEYEINPNHPLQVQFEAVPDPTGIALEYLWSFGDGHSSDLFNPRHEYERPGSYEVCLQVINPVTGCTDVVCKVIVVGGGDCTAFFEAFPSAIDNFTYIFEARDTRDGLIYTWDFGDGHTIEGGGPRERHTYQDPGIYIACLKVEDTLNNCRDQYCQEIFVEVIQDCHADFSWCPDSTGTSPFAIRFKPVIPPIDLGLEYHWTFGDGSTSNEESPVHLFPGPGEYEVCLVVQTPDGSCIDRQCEVIRLGEGICDATFSYTEPASLEITFSANTLDPDLEYFWFFSDSPTLRRGPVVTHRFPHEGHYLVCLTVEGDDCQETYCDTVFVSTGGGNCVANYSYLVEPGGIYHFFNHSTGSTPNAQLTYHWDFGDGTTSTEENPTHGFPNGNNYEVCLTISDATGCTATICQNIGGYTIEGEVFATNSQVFNGIAYLIYHDPINQTLTAIDSAFVQGSQYAFHGVGPGTYLVKAALLPGSPNYHSFLPTYLGDKLFWHQAISVVIATSDVYLPPINLVPGANPGGPGFIGGLISEGANKQAGDPLANVSVLLLDIDEHAITHTVTNEAGEYSFDNLAWGTYKVFVEIPGKLADPWIITIGPDQPEMTSADFVVEEFTITTGFDKPSFGEVLSLYPNPATNTVYVDLELKTAEKLTLSLISMMGQEVLRQQVQLTAGRHQLKLPVEHIPEGVYLLNIRAKEQLIAIRMIKQ